jgi:hypothetical protein
MLYRYAFPVFRHGEILSVTRYVEASHSPTLDELLSLFTYEKEVTESKSIIKEIDDIIFCLNNLSVSEFPQLPFGNSKTIPVLCETKFKSSTIRVSVIEPVKLDDHLVVGQQ